MSDYHIRGRVETYGGNSFAAIVVAVPSGANEPAHHRQAICRSRAQALARMRELAVQMGSDMRKQGHTILEVNTND